MSTGERLAGLCQSRMLAWCLSSVSLVLIALSGSAQGGAASTETHTRSLVLVVGLSVCGYPLVHAALRRRTSLHGPHELVLFGVPALLVVAESLLLFNALFAAASFRDTISSSLACFAAPLLSVALDKILKDDSERGSGVGVQANWLSNALITTSAVLCSWLQSTHAIPADALAGSAAPTSSNSTTNLMIGLLLALVAPLKWRATRWAQTQAAMMDNLAQRPAAATGHATTQDTSHAVLNTLLSSCVLLLLLCLVLFTLLATASSPLSNTLFCHTTLLSHWLENAHSTAINSAGSSRSQPPSLAIPGTILSAATLCGVHVGDLFTVSTVSSTAYVSAKTLVWAVSLLSAMILDALVSSSVASSGATAASLMVALFAALATLRDLMTSLSTTAMNGSTDDASALPSLSTATALAPPLKSRTSDALLLSVPPTALGPLPDPTPPAASPTPRWGTLALHSLPALAVLVLCTFALCHPPRCPSSHSISLAALQNAATAGDMHTVHVPPVHAQALLSRAKTIEKIMQLRHSLAALYADHILPGQPVALFAVPKHWNLGDSFIWQGQKALLDSLGLNLVYTCFNVDCLTDFGALARVIGNGTILIHGGGNYGDLYPTHNTLTTQLLARFRRNRVVQLPQSIYYRNASLAVADVRQHFAHPNFYIMVRDQFSYDFLHDVFSTSLSGLAHLPPYNTYHQRIIRCPDSAIAIGPVLPNCQPTFDVVYLSRRDSEKVHSTSDIQALLVAANLTHTVLDWMADWRRVFPMPLYRAHPASIAEYPLFRLHAANNMLCRGRVVLSDRLHASILALLMGRPFVGVDNEYHKMERVMQFMFADPSFGPPLAPHTMNHFIEMRTADVVPRIQSLLKAFHELQALLRA